MIFGFLFTPLCSNEALCFLRAVTGPKTFYALQLSTPLFLCGGFNVFTLIDAANVHKRMRSVKRRHLNLFNALRI